MSAAFLWAMAGIAHAQTQTPSAAPTPPPSLAAQVALVLQLEQELLAQRTILQQLMAAAAVPSATPPSGTATPSSAGAATPTNAPAAPATAPSQSGPSALAPSGAPATSPLAAPTSSFAFMTSPSLDCLGGACTVSLPASPAPATTPGAPAIDLTALLNFLQNGTLPAPAGGGAPVTRPGGRPYLVGTYQNPADPNLAKDLGAPIDYTLNNTYETADQRSWQLFGLDANRGYPAIIDLYHVWQGAGAAEQRAAAQGAYAANYADTLDTIKPFASSIYAVRIDSEFNGSWAFYHPQVAAQDWINGWRALAQAVRQALPDAKIVWNPNAGQDDPRPFYPGDDLVDVIGLDVYAFSQYYATSSAAVTDLMTGSWGNIAGLGKFAQQHGKPYCFPEWGDTFGDGTFITAMGQYINDPANNVVCHTFWDSSDSIEGTSSLAAYPQNRAAFIAAFGKKPYAGTFWKALAVPTGS